MKAGIFALLALSITVTGCSRTDDSRKTASGSTVHEYTDWRLCAGCHAEIAASYRKTGMGRSFYRATSATLNIEDFERNNQFEHKLSDRNYQMIRRDGRFFLRRSQTGFAGQEAHVLEREIHYVLGSGNHARSYLHRTPENRLIELPVGWYAEKGGFWAMSPGYDRADHLDFRRPIAYSCIFCHNAYPRLDKGQDAAGADPIYPAELPEGIDCQRCHGPGRAHVEAAQSARPAKQIRSAVVNPARLPKERQLEVCMQCHLETTTFPLPNAIQRLDRGTFSYRAGEPLANYILHFDHAKRSGHEDKFEIASSAYRLRQSACFLKSGGALTCTTCHDPHRVPRGAETVQHYAAVCKSCHARAHTPSPDCASCHMPKRRTEDVVHVAVTDHKIQRRAVANPLAPRRERHEVAGVSYLGKVELYYPSEITASSERDLYLALAQVAQASNLKEGIPQLEAALTKHNPASPEIYFELAQAQLKANRRSEAIATYRRALEKNPNFQPALRSLGAALLDSGDVAGAILTLGHARDPAARYELAKAYQQAGRLNEAIDQAKEALRLDPALTLAHHILGDLTGSEQAYREAIRIQPDFSEAHNDLASLLVARQDFPQANYHFGVAIQLAPKSAPIRYNYGVALAIQQRFAQAEDQFQQAAALSPAMAEAHESLGNLKGLRRDWRGAIRHYQDALRARPEFPQALLGMGTALGASGDFFGARSYLRRAAATSDSRVRQEAAELLRSLEEPPPSR